MKRPLVPNLGFYIAAAFVVALVYLISDRFILKKDPAMVRIEILDSQHFSDLRLTGQDDTGIKALDLLSQIINSRMNTSTFTLVFNESFNGWNEGRIFDSKGRILETIAECGDTRIRDDIAESTGDRCTHVFPPSLEGLDAWLHPERYRGKQCGNIAVAHSIFKLGLLDESEVFNNGFLNQTLIQSLNIYHESTTPELGMNWQELKDAHRSFSTIHVPVNCIFPLRGEVGTFEIDEMFRTASFYINSEDPVFDCSLSVFGNKDADGKYRLGHVEHIKSIETNDEGNYEIATVNGFDQGTTDSTIPKEPGSNTWEFGQTVGKFIDGSRANKNQFGPVFFEKVEINCCCKCPE